VIPTYDLTKAHFLEQTKLNVERFCFLNIRKTLINKFTRGENWIIINIPIQFPNVITVSHSWKPQNQYIKLFNIKSIHRVSKIWHEILVCWIQLTVRSTHISLPAQSSIVLGDIKSCKSSQCPLHWLMLLI
jgi:hypothetical protein